MQFINPYLAAGWIIGTLILLPIVIHLINMMRYRRVKWAAMEFLLAAHKKKSTWILLKQLLLLLARISALLILMLILAQMLYNADLSTLLSGVTTHHVVIIDNTYSMSDKSVGEKTPLEAAKAEAIKIGESVIRSPGRHEFTLLTYADAKQKNFLLNKRTVSPEFINTIQSVVNGIQATELSLTPQGAIDAVKTIEQPKNERRRIYVLSDFRHRDWGTPDDLNAQFQEMSEHSTVVNLVQCARTEHENLSVASLKPRAGALAAGISVVMDVAVTNHSTTPKNNVAILRVVDGHTLTPISIPSIAPGKTETRSFEVEFDRPGMHRVTAQLQAEDSIAADNVRHTSLEVHEGIPVLIVDGLLATGETRGADAKFIELALKPGTFHSGIVPEIQPPQFLGSPKANLRKYQGIFLCNFEKLSDPAIEALEKYVEAGGGLAIFLGEQTNHAFINGKLYAEGQGLFPLPLAAPYDLIVDRVERAPDIDPEVEHPVFRVFGGEGGKFLSEIALWRYFATNRDWKPEEKSTVKVVARLRNQAPLVVEHQFRNAGRVAAFLTTAGPMWNDWARHLTYLVAIQELRNYLAPPFIDRSRPVGSDLVDASKPEDALHPNDYEAGYLWQSTGWEEKGEMKIDDQGGYLFPHPKMAGGTISKSGIYDLHLTTRDQKPVTRTYVLNVDPEEGNLKLVGNEELRKRYDASGVQVLLPGAIGGQIDDSTRSNLSEMLLYGLIFLLVCEQMLAYSASYHPPALKGGVA
jgi:hypothetical protein